MRPPSIVMFERLFIASLVVSAISYGVAYDEVMRAIASDPGMQAFGLGSGFINGVMLVSFVIYLLLWYLIAHRASSVAKWILVVFVALSLFSLPGALTGPFDLSLALALAVYALEIAALVYLFRPDAKAWFRGEQPADPGTFD